MRPVDPSKADQWKTPENGYQPQVRKGGVVRGVATVLSAAGPVQVRDMCDEALTGQLRAGGQVYLIAWKPMLIHQHQNDAR
jgi:hypothetical protein